MIDWNKNLELMIKNNRYPNYDDMLLRIIVFEEDKLITIEQKENLIKLLDEQELKNKVNN